MLEFPNHPMPHRSIAILQARSTSSRLPGKAFLPICGIPLVVLATRRAANTGRHVIVATSDEPTDDALARLLADAGICCYRGSLKMTLQRFVGALEGFHDDTLVFRLTGDNVFPDGRLLDDIEKDFLQNGLNFLSCGGVNSGLPYGMSAELSRARYFREASACSQDAFDQEHVTPYIRRRYGNTCFEKYRHLNKSHFRCTIDNFDDYLTIQHVFANEADPVGVPALELVSRLEGAPYQPQQSAQPDKLVLGTAQLGLNYGISNFTGQPKPHEAAHLLKTAITNGVTYLDTAHAYGESETLIGDTLQSGWQGRATVITKLSPLTQVASHAHPTTVRAAVDASIYQSCISLRTWSLDVLMLHRASHLSAWSGSVWNQLLAYKAKGQIRALGASVQTPDELALALASEDVTFIQMPFNVLDHRWDPLIPSIRETKKRRSLAIHARSALLQGLLLQQTQAHWARANVQNMVPIMDWLSDQCAKTGRSGLADFCLTFVRSIDWIDGVVVGMERLTQLNANIRTFSQPPLKDHEICEITRSRPILSAESLDPASWRA